MNKDQLLTALQKALTEQSAFDLKDLSTKALELYPDEAFGLYYMGEAHLLGWDYANAVSAFEELIQKFGENVLYLQKLAFAYFKNQEADKGIEIYERLLAEEPENPIYHAEYGKLLVAISWETEHIKKGIQHIETALKSLGNFIELRLELAVAYQHVSENDQALAQFELILAEHPNDAITLQHRVELNKLINKPEAVKTDLQHLLRLRPDDVHMIQQYADFLDSNGEYTAAIEYYNQQIRIQTEQGWELTGAYVGRASAYIHLQNHTAALADYNQALAWQPESVEILEKRADLQLLMGDEQAFLDDIQTILKTEPFNQYAYLLKRASFYTEREVWDKAEKDYKSILEDENMSFNHGDAWFGLGGLAQRRGDIPAAYDYWLKAKEAQHQEAEKAIETYCAEFLKQAHQERQAALRIEFANESTRNQNSPILQALFGKIWRVDLEHSLANSPSLNALPSGLVGFFAEAFRNVSVTISNQVLIIHNPLHADIEAFYKIVEETPEMVHILGKPIGDKPPRQLILSRAGEYMKVNGLMTNGANDKDSISLFFKEETSPAAEEDKAQAEARMRKLAENFLTGLLQTVVQGFESVFGSKGEAAKSDIAPEDIINE